MSLKHEFLKSFEPVDKKDGFDVCLFRLIKRADKDNLIAFKDSFPKHYKIYEMWKRFSVDFSNDEIFEIFY